MRTQVSSSLHHLVRRWLVAEYCDSNFYSGWHLYLREKPGYQTRNKDGGWGWIRSLNNDKIVAFFATLGIELKEDWPCPEYGLAEFVKRYPLKGRKVGGEKRGGVKVLVGEWGDLTLAPKLKPKNRAATKATDTGTAQNCNGV